MSVWEYGCMEVGCAGNHNSIDCVCGMFGVICCLRKVKV